ncbi:MAG TPA: Na+/H+ antiporter NhaA, partial [Candidatus Edwardsbacteria bacterium]|nr:Na+/H+ antiporter NhaA [Candidatus Edwardsbacteria bacterium]
MRRQLNEFLDSEQAGGVILLACTVLSLVLTNLPFGRSYAAIWQAVLAGQPIVHWINDGLMAVFFLLIGLELKRELSTGELASGRRALLPVVAALGGMIAPALVYALFNFGTPLHVGAGIPVATDIAFSLAVLSLLGRRVPASLKVFLTAFAVMDDLGAVLVIALFYRGAISWPFIGLTAATVLALLAMNRLRVRTLVPYLAAGVLLWYCTLHSGVHAALAGVLLAYTIPDGRENAPASRLERFLNRPVAFVILPLFALANTCLALSGTWYLALASASSIGIILGLLVGKPLVIVLSSYAVV